MIDEKLIKDLRQYIIVKTGKSYFNQVRNTPKSIMVSCPFHKQGQERKPSCGIKKDTDNKGLIGTVHCFTCDITTDILSMIGQILGSKYNEQELESLFRLRTIVTNSNIEYNTKVELFKIPQKFNTTEMELRNYNYYHPYLEQRRISQEVAQIYNIGYDDFNKHITFPIRDTNKNILGVGRRSILQKKYIYPYQMEKPLYGVYELPRFVRYLWIVEGPFNLWSLKGWHKSGVALLGTGTEAQYNQLLNINCSGYVLALDPDEAGIKGTNKLINFLLENKKYNIYIALLPNGKDINDLTEQEFNTLHIVTYKQFNYLQKVK